MKKIILTICSAGLFLCSCNNAEKTETPAADMKTDSAAAKTETAAPAPPMDTAAMNKAWADFMTPGENHKWMAKFNGTWEAEVTEYMNPAGPSKTKATQVFNTVLGGRYQEGKYSGNMMGQPFEGRSTMGYDNAKKKFVSTWIDNVGSGIVVMWGSYDEASKTLNLKGVQTDPMTGKDSDIREELKIIDDNSHSMSMYGAGPDGKEMKFMEAVFKRKK